MMKAQKLSFEDLSMMHQYFGRVGGGAPFVELRAYPSGWESTKRVTAREHPWERAGEDADGDMLVRDWGFSHTRPECLHVLIPGLHDKDSKSTTRQESVRMLRKLADLLDSVSDADFENVVWPPKPSSDCVETSSPDNIPF